MSSTLTKAQIAVFGEFRNHVENTLMDATVPTKNATNRVVNTLEGITLFIDLLVNVAKPSGYAPCMNSSVKLEKDGASPVNSVKGYTADKKPIWMFKTRCARMYTAEAYRAARFEAIGRVTPETIFAMEWSKLPSDMRQKVAAKFPRKSKNYPEFAPKMVGIVVRKGNKPEKGEKRHQWSRLQFLVIGQYGDKTVCIPDAIVWNGETNDSGSVIRRLADVTGCPDEFVPIWNETAVPVSKAANAKVAPTDAFDDILDF